MRLDRFAADLPVGQIGTVTFALSPSLRGATRRNNPAFFVAATKLDCFASLAMTARSLAGAKRNRVPVDPFAAVLRISLRCIRATRCLRAVHLHARKRI